MRTNPTYECIGLLSPDKLAIAKNCDLLMLAGPNVLNDHIEKPLRIIRFAHRS
jgi:hypothetical protein